jgi:hypothetical protein
MPVILVSELAVAGPTLSDLFSRIATKAAKLLKSQRLGGSCEGGGGKSGELSTGAAAILY